MNRPFFAELARPIGRAFDLLLPPCCVLCSSTLEAGVAPVCPACWHRLPRVLHPRCKRCGATRLTPSERGGCAACSAWPLVTLRTASAYRMRDDAARLLRYLKYSGWTALGTQMGSALVEAASGLISLADVSPAGVTLAPVPIAPSRLRERGFNQADLLAKGLGLAMHAEVETLLERRRADRSQAKLARRERMINVHRQFQAIRPAGPPDPPVLLVDDVVTTGATAAACTTALTAAGWTAIGLVSFARAWRTLEPAGNSPLRM